MPVNYIKLQNQIKAMGEHARTYQAEMDIKLSNCKSLLADSTQDLIRLQRLVEEAAARNKGLRCACPVNEPLTTHQPLPGKSPPCTIIASDGSQINPDPHDRVLYGLVNLGIFIIQTGSGLTPRESTFTELLFGEEIQTPGGLASEDLIALLRDVNERRKLAELASLESAPVVTLTDGPLELFHEPRQEKPFRAFFDDYLKALDDLAIRNITTAGYISRPRANLVVSLLGLLNLEKHGEAQDTPFSGITDTMLLGDFLAEGERSAVFKLQSSSSKDYTGRKALHFFYLNVGNALQPAFARVEIPAWVAENADAVNLLHCVLVEQSRILAANPYPYPLIRAHEIALVKRTDREQVTQMVQAELLRLGLPLGKKSEKQIQKDDVGKKRSK